MFRIISSRVLGTSTTMAKNGVSELVGLVISERILQSAKSGTILVRLGVESFSFAEYLWRICWLMVWRIEVSVTFAFFYFLMLPEPSSVQANVQLLTVWLRRDHCFCESISCPLVCQHCLVNIFHFRFFSAVHSWSLRSELLILPISVLPTPQKRSIFPCPYCFLVGDFGDIIPSASGEWQH